MQQQKGTAQHTFLKNYDDDFDVLDVVAAVTDDNIAVLSLPVMSLFSFITIIE